MKYELNQVYRLQNGRLGTLHLNGSKTELRTSDLKILPFSTELGKYSPLYPICENKPFFLSDTQILNHLQSRSKRLLGDTVVVYDGSTFLTPTDTELKATLQYRKSAAQRWPTFILSHTPTFPPLP